MPRTSAVHAVTTIGIDMGKNTLHMVGLDKRGASTVTFWLQLSETSWRVSPGRCWHKSAVMKRASPRQQPNENAQVHRGDGWRLKLIRKQELAFPPRSASWKEEMEKKVSPARS